VGLWERKGKSEGPNSREMENIKGAASEALVILYLTVVIIRVFYLPSPLTPRMDTGDYVRSSP
jgi:hypothetical protein